MITRNTLFFISKEDNPVFHKIMNRKEFHEIKKVIMYGKNCSNEFKYRITQVRMGKI